MGALFTLDLVPVSQACRIWGHHGSMIRVAEVADNITYDLYKSIKTNLTMPNDNTHALNQVIAFKTADIFSPSCSFALDEMLIKFYGKYKFVHHMPKKPAMIGLKPFVKFHLTLFFMMIICQHLKA